MTSKTKADIQQAQLARIMKAESLKERAAARKMMEDAKSASAALKRSRR